VISRERTGGRPPALIFRTKNYEATISLLRQNCEEAMATHQSKAQKETVERVMHEYKHCELTTSRGRKVKNPKQAIALGGAFWSAMCLQHEHEVRVGGENGPATD
jgi:hypothetical protein